MNKHIKNVVVYVFPVIVLILMAVFICLKPFSNNTKEKFEKQFKRIEERYAELLNRPLPKTKDQLDNRIADSEKLKDDEKILISQAKKAKIIGEALDTKQKLLEKIDSKIGVLNDMILSSLDISNSEQKDELARAKQHIIELKNFREKVEVANDKESMNSLIKEYVLTLMYKKVRIKS